MAVVMLVSRWVVCTVLLLAIAQVAMADGDGAPGDSLPPLEPLEDIPMIVQSLAPILIPKVIGDIWLLKQYIVSGEFASYRTRFGDRYAVDAIFRRAQILSWNNLFESLLISFFASIDHRNVGIRLPLVGPLLWFPLTAEFPGEFQRRVAALPSSVTPDSPQTPGKDRDKLQHFFGSALLAFVSESPSVVERVGSFVEWGEEKFVVGGAVDNRDQAANIQGGAFGYRLLSDRSCRPSEFLRAPLAKELDVQFHALPE